MFQHSTAMSLAPQSNFSSVLLASDHAGFERKKYIHERLVDAGYTTTDYGPSVFDPSDDYPGIIRSAVSALQPEACAIIFGKSGQGEAMVANRVRGVRAALYTGGNLEIVTLAREHNNANVLSVGAGFVGDVEAWEAVTRFLSTPFSNEERHVRRVRSIDE